MRSVSSAGIAAALGIVLLAGCGGRPSANDPHVRGIGYVRLDEAVKKAPLYPQLSQIESAIDALNLKSLGASAVPRSGAQMTAETKHLDAELKAAQARASAALQQKQNDYAQREQQAIRAALASAGAGTNGAAPAQSMQSTSAAQARAVTDRANNDFRAYQQSVVAQDNAAVRAIANQLEDQANQAYRQRALQLQENESQLSLQLSQQDASKRLELRTKLNNLAMDDATRNALQQQLNAIAQREQRVVDAQRAADQRQLAAYRQTLQAGIGKKLAVQEAQIRKETAAKLAARRDQVQSLVRSQLQGIAPVGIPSNLSKQTKAKIAAIDRDFRSQYLADARKTIQQYQAEKSNLDEQYAVLQGANGAASGAAAAELVKLQHERDNLYNKIVAQIQSDARTDAAKRGLQVVFVNVAAAAGGIDLTDDVEKDLASINQ